MNIEGAVDVAFRKVYEAEPDPASGTPGDRRPLPLRVSGRSKPRAGFGVDDVIDPADREPSSSTRSTNLPRRRVDGIATRTRGISPI